MKQEDLAVYFAEMLAKQNATPEEKKIQALIKSALYEEAFYSSKNVKVDTVKGVTEYFKANSEIQIRKADYPEEEKERLINEASNRLVQGEVWVLGTLAHLGYLED